MIKIFGKSFLKNGILEFWYEALSVLILTYSSNDNKVHELWMNQNIIFTEMRQPGVQKYKKSTFSGIAFDLCIFYVRKKVLRIAGACLLIKKDNTSDI